jgi:hypothetical protein
MRNLDYLPEDKYDAYEAGFRDGKNEGELSAELAGGSGYEEGYADGIQDWHAQVMIVFAEIDQLLPRLPSAVRDIIVKRFNERVK